MTRHRFGWIQPLSGVARGRGEQTAAYDGEAMRRVPLSSVPELASAADAGAEGPPIPNDLLLPSPLRRTGGFWFGLSLSLQSQMLLPILPFVRMDHIQRRMLHCSLATLVGEIDVRMEIPPIQNDQRLKQSPEVVAIPFPQMTVSRLPLDAHLPS